MYKDSLIYFSSKLIPGMMGLFNVVFFVRIIGVEQYGQYALAFSVMTMISALLVSWLNQSQLRYFSHFTNNSVKYRVVLRISLKIILSLTVLTGFLVLLLSPFLSIPLPQTSLFLIVLLCCLFVPYLVRMVTFQAMMRPAEVVKMEALRALLAFLIPLILSLIWLDHRALLIGLCFAYGLCFLLPDPWKGDVKFKTSASVVNKDILAMFWRYGWPMSLWSGVMLCLPVIDRSLIQHFYGFELTGAYSGIYDLVIRVYSLIFFPVTLAAHPRIMAAWNSNDQKGAYRLILKTVMLQFALFIPFFLLNIFGAPYFSRIFLGHPVPEMSAAILPLACGGALWQVALVVHKPLEMTGHTKVMLIFIFIALLVSLLVNYFGLPQLGLVAAAYANLLSAVCYIVLCSLFIFIQTRNMRLVGVIK